MYYDANNFNPQIPAQLQQLSELTENGGIGHGGVDADFDKKVKRISAAARDAIRLQTPESHQLSLCVPDTVTVCTDNPNLKIDQYPPIIRVSYR